MGRVMIGGGGGQESVNQKFTLHLYSYTARIKVILTPKKSLWYSVLKRT